MSRRDRSHWRPFWLAVAGVLVGLAVVEISYCAAQSWLASLKL